MLRLDYLSCVLKINSTILVGRRCWEGWLLATVNCVIMCVIGLKTDQLGLIPANLFCIVMSVVNLRTWRKRATASWEFADAGPSQRNLCHRSGRRPDGTRFDHLRLPVSRWSTSKLLLFAGALPFRSTSRYDADSYAAQSGGPKATSDPLC